MIDLEEFINRLERFKKNIENYGRDNLRRDYKKAYYEYKEYFARNFQEFLNNRIEESFCFSSKEEYKDLTSLIMKKMKAAAEDYLNSNLQYYYDKLIDTCDIECMEQCARNTIQVLDDIYIDYWVNVYVELLDKEKGTYIVNLNEEYYAWKNAWISIREENGELIYGICKRHMLAPTKDLYYSSKTKEKVDDSGRNEKVCTYLMQREG